MDLNGNKSTDFFELAMVTVRKPLIFLILLLLPNTIQYNTIQKKKELSLTDGQMDGRGNKWTNNSMDGQSGLYSRVHAMKNPVATNHCCILSLFSALFNPPRERLPSFQFFFFFNHFCFFLFSYFRLSFYSNFFLFPFLLFSSASNGSILFFL